MNKIFQIHKNYIFVLLNLLFLSYVFNAYSQNLCSKLPISCKTFGTPFGVSQQSMNTTMQPGQKALYNIVVYKGFVYRISLCVNNSIGGVYFQILSNNRTNTVLFDSSIEDAKKQEMILDIDFSSNYVIKVVYPKPEIKCNKGKDVCIRVLIEYYRKDKR